MALKGVSSSAGGGGPPSGAAGGDLGGTYPNPTVTSIADVTTGVLPIANGGTGVNSSTLLQSYANVPKIKLLPRWHAALGRVISGTGPAKIMTFGDSQTEGKYATTDGTPYSTSNYINNYPGRLKQYFNSYSSSLGILAYQTGIFGNSTGVGTRVAGDARLTATGAFTSTLNLGTLGSTYFAAAATGTMTFTPAESVDTFVVYYGTYSGGGTFSYAIDGGSATNVSTNSGTSNAKVVIPTTLGAHTLTISYVSGSEVFIQGFEAYNSAANYIQIYQAGVGGVTTATMATQTTIQFPIGVIKSVAPDLVILEAGQNDLIQGATQATTIANLQTIITALQPTMDIVIVDQIPLPTSGSTFLSQTVQDNWSAAVKSLAATNNIPVIDIYDRWGSFAAINAYDYYGSTTAGSDGSLHPGHVGYTDYARAIFEVIGVL